MGQATLADPAPVAALAGFPAGADLGRAPRRHPQRAAREPRQLAYATLPPARGAIRVANVDFRYAADGPEVLKAISLDIPEGQVIGIVGPSGSGKSTLTKLIQRLYRPERGPDLHRRHRHRAGAIPRWLRRQIGVVLQENLLFNRTIHENIALANPGHAARRSSSRRRVSPAPTSSSPGCRSATTR